MYICENINQGDSSCLTSINKESFQ